MQAKVRDLLKYMVLTYIYPIFSKFEGPFWASLHSFLPHDQYGREVVVWCEAAVSYFAGLLAGLLDSLLTYLLACLVGLLFG